MACRWENIATAEKAVPAAWGTPDSGRLATRNTRGNPSAKSHRSGGSNHPGDLAVPLYFRERPSETIGQLCGGYVSPAVL
jgi:hypothetical protein